MAPFVYALGYIVILLIYNTASDIILDVLDDLFYISPVVIIVNLVYSRILKFCVWHKVACLLPIIPEAANLCDPFFVEYSLAHVQIINITVGITSILFIISAYRVFFCDGC